MSFYHNYLKSMCDAIQAVDVDLLAQSVELFVECRRLGGKIIFAGNGGSASIASHVAVDLTKTAGIRAINFNEPDLITCLGNDFGYERWVEKAIDFYFDKNDMVVLISSSGRSPNILNAARRVKDLGLQLITFSGFKKDNPLRKKGDMNFWVNSCSYNVVEMTHHIWLLAMVDKIIESNEKCSLTRMKGKK